MTKEMADTSYLSQAGINKFDAIFGYIFPFNSILDGIAQRLCRASARVLKETGDYAMTP
jgi:hypothetical protein